MNRTAFAARLSGLLLLLASQVQAAAPPLMETLRGEQAIELRSLQVVAKLRGGLAETTVRMDFFNPNGRPLEGNLQFPLLAGQDVSAFALDIDGKLRAAVPVRKAKGRQVFEAVERQRIDPALLEKTQGNNFRLRVFPIPARGVRTVELRYTESLAREGRDWIYRLPLAYGDRLRDFDLVIETDDAGQPRAAGALGALAFEHRGGLYRAHVAREKFSPSGSLSVSLPNRSRPQVFTQAFDGDTFFVAEIPLAGARVERRLPHVIGLLWDSSGSGAARATEAELAELDLYFQAVANAEVRLVRLRDHAEAPVSYKIANGDWSALRRELQSTVYDGASAIADWKAQADVGEYLLVSDGLLNYGPLAFPSLADGQRLYALNSSQRADDGRLRAVAERSGGRLLHVSAQAPGAAARLLLTDGPRLEGVTGTGVADLQLESSDPVGGWARVAGRLLSPTASITTRVASEGSSAPITIGIDSRAIDHPLAARLWAGYRLAALEASPELQRAEIARIGTRFSMPTSETSLIVLDRVEDYVRYEIAPPAELAVAFQALRAEADRERRRNRDEHLDDVAGQFNEKLKWYETAFPKGAPPVIAPSKARPVPMVAMAATADAADAAAAAADAAADAAAEPASASLDTVTVQGNGTINAVDVASVESTTILSAEQLANIPMPRNTTSVALLAPGTTRNAPAAPPPSSAPAQSPALDAVIAMKRWEADAPYMARMKAARPEELYAIYLDERPGYEGSSGFYLDVADLLLAGKQTALGLRVLSNLAEMDLENRHILRILGYRLVQAGRPELAIPVFEKVRWLAEEEPQSFRDLGNAQAAAGHDQQAIESLYEVVQRPWDDRFSDIELIALAELNAIAARAGKTVDTGGIDPRLRRNLPLDLRVVLTWDADNSDMDLWVTDPNGEKCYYSHKLTYQGGRLSDDFTGGYGPEEFSLRTAKPGKYRIETNYFGDRQQSVAGATTLQLRFTTGFGTAKAKEQLVTLRLKDAKETVLVGEFVVR